MPAQPGNQPPVGPVFVGKAEREKEARKRLGAVPGRRPTGAGGSGSRWTALDLLSTLATVIFLFSVTGYANATPLGTVEDTLDAFFEEVWDNADEATIASQRTMIEMVRSAHEDARAYAASSGRAGSGRTSDLSAPFVPDALATPAPTPRATAQLASQPASAHPSASNPLLTTGAGAPSAALGVRATPTEDARPAPTSTPTRRVVISTGLPRPPAQDRRTADASNSSGPPRPYHPHRWP